ncbi:MAG: methionyl-tRNA formyltransferase [Dehalococcoidia bacterium]|nr:MAG: methionyl-tRNA formyltransferase [Dehalococcoidia bacterium]
MRIVLIAHPSLGSKVLEAILKTGEEVVAVFAPGADPEKPVPLKEVADKNGIPVHQPRHMKDAGVYESIASYKPDLGVMAFTSDIVPLAILDCPKLGTIMYHPSLLPKHRGGSALNWPIIQGETKTGLTIIWPDQGIDTGPILLQKEVDILPDDSVGSLFFNKLYPMGVEAFVEAIQLIKEGKAPRIPQDDSQATYEPLCQEQHGIIDWTKPAQGVYNLIRGTNPQPGASTTWQGQKLKIFDSELIKSTPLGAPGEVTSISEETFVIACRDGSIMVKRVQPAGCGKITAAEFIKNVNLKKGDRLG